MRYLDVCSGYSAPTVAWQGLGFECAGYSEIEAFPRAVLEQRHGAVAVDFDHEYRPGANAAPLFGDFTRIEASNVGPVHLLVGGTPCQAFSVAGKRLGLDDPRGNLTLEWLALAGRLRPKWVVWENVPGVLHDDKGRTLGTFLRILGELGYGWAYRVLDAQHVRVGMFGRAVPQRRRRVFVVGCLGDPAAAAAVLFDRSSLRGDPAPRREAGEGVAGTLAASSGRRGGVGAGFGGGLIADTTLKTMGADAETSCSVTSKWAKGGGPAGQEYQNLVVADVACTLNAGGNSTGGNRQPGMGAETAGTLLIAKMTEAMSVRRLTPTECERLQGLPDGFTAITYRGKPAADGPRYKAIGNSMAINVMRYIGERIAAVDAATMRKAA